MQKIRLEIVGLSSGQSHGSYTLILGETEGSRKLPVIIGNFEAQAIALVIEKITPFRPMTHDLFMSFSKNFGVEIMEVIIHKLQDGVFYSKLICNFEGTIKEIDARTSDAIALAVRFKCPIYTFEDIMSSVGIVIEDEPVSEDEEEVEEEIIKAVTSKDDLASYTEDELNVMLDEAINIEDYGRAAAIRDEINRRKSG